VDGELGAVCPGQALAARKIFPDVRWIALVTHTCYMSGMTAPTTLDPNSRPKAKTGYINARVTPTLKRDAERVLGALGVSTSEAITMFLRQVVLHQGLPFPVRVPNAETIAKIRAAREDPSTLTEYDTVDAPMADVWPEDSSARKGDDLSLT